MSIHGVIRDAWQDSDREAHPCLAIEVTPDVPTSWAHHPCAKLQWTPGTPWPVAVGDRVEVPAMHNDGHIKLADGRQVRMIGGLYDRDAALA